MLKLRLAIVAFGLTLLFVPLAAQAADNRDVLNTTYRLRLERTEGNEVVTGHGTAFGVDLSEFGMAKRQYLLSAAHLVLGPDKKLAPGNLRVEVPHGNQTRWIDCRVAAIDDYSDLCLLEAKSDLPALARLGEGQEKIGATLLVVGCPRGVVPQISPGKLITKQPPVEGQLWQAAAQFYHGNSGGPVFDAVSRKVAGVAVAGVRGSDGDMDRNVALFAPMSSVRRFLGRVALVY